VYTIFGDKMIKKLKKIVMPIFLSVLCGMVCGRLMFSIYEDKGSSMLNSNIIYLLEGNSYDDYDSMKASVISSDYIYYEDNGRYNAVIGITKNKDNIDKIKNIYGSDIKVSEYLLSSEEINSEIEKLDSKLESASENDDIREIIIEMINIYKDRDDIKMAKIS